MSSSSPHRWFQANGIVGAVLCGILLGSPAGAQLQTGNLFGTVFDEQVSPLPGVTITLAGGGAPQVQISNAQGEFRFVGLAPGRYLLKAELEGFSTVEYPNIQISVGRNTVIEITLASAVEDVITVTGEAPLLDERRFSKGNTFSLTELEKIPMARDPWAILQSTPGVLTDRINVGGNESGQQSQYVGPGSVGDQATWTVDGVVITDMASLGSIGPYDLGTFEEVQVTTGGGDIATATGGVVLNAVTRRGTNEWRGSGRVAALDDALQSDSSIRSPDLGRDFDGPGLVTAQPPLRRADHLVRLRDAGVELGGPIIKDRLWIWGAYSWIDADLQTMPGPASPDGVRDASESRTIHLKINGQLSPNNSAILFVLDSDAERSGGGAGPTRPQETTLLQSDAARTPTGFKLEDTHIFTSSLYVTALYTRVNSGVELVPRGGADRMAVLDRDDIWHDSFLRSRMIRPQEQLRGDASVFFNTGSLSHEVKLGASYLQVEEESRSAWPGGGLLYNGPSFFGTAGDVLALSRPSLLSIEQERSSAYLQDTLTSGNLTINAGLRYDLQRADNRSAAVAANPLRPDLLPAPEYGGDDPAPAWDSLVPRIGATYSLGVQRHTLLSAACSVFTDQMSPIVASWLNPLASQSYAYLELPGRTEGLRFFSPNVDPRSGRLLQSNAVDPSLRSPRTLEVLLGIEHAIRPEFVMGLKLTYRKLTSLLEQDLLVFEGDDPYCAACFGAVGRPHRRSDYESRNVAVTLPDGQPATRTYYQLRPGLSTRLGTRLRNGDREQEYRGASLTLHRRLANHWMLRGNFTWSDWEWSRVPDHALEDPTLTFPGRIPRRGPREGDPVIQGPEDPDFEESAYLQSTWSYNLGGLYQVAPDRPWGFNVAFNLNGRQGSPIPYFFLVPLPESMQFERLRVQATDEPDRFRLDDLHTLDLRVEKEISFSDDFLLTAGIDVLNATNEATVLRRQPRLDIATSAHVLEALNPRIFRFGVRLTFR